jgi:predicted enzyme related to lactoylglutathione lyase
VNLSGILIGSEDAEQLARYYTKLFGPPDWDMSPYVAWQIGQGYLTIGPHDEVHGPNVQPGRLIWNIETSDVQGEFERLRDAGATVIREPYVLEGAEDVGAICTLADPDGNYFQLVSPMS